MSVDKIKVGISQKINLGSYETRDYHVELDITGFDSDNAEEVQKAVDFGREFCLRETQSYYDKVKGITGEARSLEVRIDGAKTEDELRKLETEIQSIEDKDTFAVLSQRYNTKLIALK